LAQAQASIISFVNPPSRAFFVLMTLRWSVTLAIAPLVAESMRVVKGTSDTETDSSRGKVDLLYTYGAPGPASPSLRNSLRSDGCFPGVRAWAGRGYGFTGTSDAVPQVTWSLGYRHNWMTSEDFDVRGDYEIRTKTCSQESEYEPRTRVVDAILHLRTYYINVAHSKSEAFGNLTDLATVGSYFDDSAYMKARTEALGWRYVDTASAPGGQITGGPQQVHLLQHPSTLECMITFQGSDSAGDWQANLDAGKSHFCGFVDEDETCTHQFGGMCEVKRVGNSFVHKGFRDHLRRMIRSSEFQNKIRPKLGNCPKLTVAGHSLGGAMSSLFTGCMNRAPRPGQYGYETDYKYISFTKGTAKRMWQ